MTDAIVFSELDSRRFGVRVYRASVADDEALREVARLDSRDDVDLVVARCPVERVRVAQTLEAAGFFLAGTLVTYRGSTAAFGSEPPVPQLVVRPLETANTHELDELISLTRGAFTDFSGHYHVDPRLDRTAATEGYVEWCLALAASRSADFVVATLGDKLAGFVASVPRTAGESVIELNAVAPRFQRRGIYGMLFRETLTRLKGAGIGAVRISTQLGNRAAQKVWIRHGLEPVESVYTFHRWYR